MVHSESHPLRGIRKKVRIIFTVENPNTQRDYEHYGRVNQDFGKSKFDNFPGRSLIMFTN